MIGDTLYGTCAKALGEGAVIFRPSAYPCEDLTSPAAENLLARPVEAPLEQSVPESDPPMRDEDVESRFAAIVAGFETEAAPAEPAEPAPLEPGPANTTPPPTPTPTPTPFKPGPANTTPTPTPTPFKPGPANTTPPSAPLEPGPAATTPPSLVPFFANVPVWRGAEGPPLDELLEAEEDARFVPAPPQPLPPQEDLHFWGILVGLVGGPILLLWLVLFRPDVANWWTWLALALTAGGFVLLVLRQPPGGDDDNGNGAVV